MKQPLLFTICMKIIMVLRKALGAITLAERATEAPIRRLAESSVRRHAAREVGVTLTADSMSQVAPIWNTYLAPFAGQPHLQILEIGSFEGCSALWFLANVATHPTARMTCIDPFYRWGEPRFDHNIRVSGQAGRVIKLKGPSEVVLPSLAPDSYAIIFIDGNHRSGSVLMDAVASWQLLMNGGILIFDDYDWRPELPVADRPKLAIDLFVVAFAGHIEVLHHGRQVLIRKTLEAGL